MRIYSNLVIIWCLIYIASILNEINSIKSAQNKRVFNIGGLLPDSYLLKRLENRSSVLDIDNENCHYDELTALDAIRFATKKLSALFEQFYGCSIQLNSADTHCDVSYGTRSFFELAKDIQRTLIVFGGSCDSTIKPIAESVQFFNLTMLSYTETDPTFSDQSKYNGFYRIVPSEEQHNDLRIHLIRKYNWTRVGTIYLTKTKYTLAHNLLIRELDKIVNVTMSRSILENQQSNQYETILNEFISDDIKIIIGLFDYNTTYKFFCEVYKKNMFGKNYQWIILGTNAKRFLHDNSDHVLSDDLDCTRDQILIALNGTLQTKIVEYSHEYDMGWAPDEKNSDSHFVQINSNNVYKNKVESEPKEPGSEFEDYYASIVESYLSALSKDFKMFSNKKSCFDSFFHGYAFDVILAIFKTFSVLAESKMLSCNTNMFERDIDWFSLLTNALNKISFKGVTGNVTFQNGSRIGQIKLEQLLVYMTDEKVLDLDEVLIYVNDQNEDKFYLKNEIKWHGKRPPTDQTIKIRELYKIPRKIFYGMAVLATSGILLALGFLFFNIKFRKHRFIKMSSPYLNNLIIVGCLFSYTSIYFLGEFDGFYIKKICLIRQWLLTIGFTLAFGAMFSKTYRVHAILTNATLTKKVIKDYKLFGIVIFLLMIDIIILVSWQVFDPLKIVRRQYDQITEGENIKIIDSLVCESSHIKIWIASLFSYKSLLILFGCFFAYETRNVTISALNDSKYIGISVYNVLIMCSSGAAIAFIVQNQNAALILMTLFIFFCTSITLCLVFIPKVLEVRQDPSGKRNQKPKSTNFKKMTSTKDQSLLYKQASSVQQDFDKKIKLLSDDNKKKIGVLEQLNKKIMSIVQSSIENNCLYLKECIDYIQSQDEQTKKLFDELKLYNLASKLDSNNYVVKNDFQKTSDCESNNRGVYNPDILVKIDHDDIENIDNDDEKSLKINPSTNTNQLNSVLPNSVATPMPMTPIKLRKFKSPPQIIDLMEEEKDEKNKNCIYKVDV